jgi:hypothetical protein
MLPLVKTDSKDRLKFHKRNFRLFVPTDFDYSPYFKVLKFPAWPLEMQESYRDLPWTEEEVETQAIKPEKTSAKDIASNIIKSLNKKTLTKGGLGIAQTSKKNKEIDQLNIDSS